MSSSIPGKGYLSGPGNRGGELPEGHQQLDPPDMVPFNNTVHLVMNGVVTCHCFTSEAENAWPITGKEEIPQMEMLIGKTSKKLIDGVDSQRNLLNGLRTGGVYGDHRPLRFREKLPVLRQLENR